MLNLPEPTVLRWLRNGVLPGRMVNGSPVFSEQDLREWANVRGFACQPSGQFQAANPAPQDSPGILAGAVLAGGCFWLPLQADRFGAVAAAASLLQLKTEVREALLERERAASTELGFGIALPHPMYPDRLALAEDRLALFFLEKPLPSSSEHHPPLFCLILLLARSGHSHLLLMAEVANRLNRSEFRQHLEAAYRDACLTRAWELWQS